MTNLKRMQELVNQITALDAQSEILSRCMEYPADDDSCYLKLLYVEKVDKLIQQIELIGQLEKLLDAGRQQAQHYITSYRNYTNKKYEQNERMVDEP